MKSSDSTDRSASVAELISLIGSIKRLLQSQTYQWQDGTRLTIGQLGILFTVKHHGPICAQDIAQKLSLTPGAVSQVVESLIEGGYLTRTVRPNNRRIQDLALTEDGAQKVTGIERKHHAIIERTTSGLSDSELAGLLAALQKIHDSLQQETRLTERK